MERLLVEWADITFIITTYNHNLNRLLIEQHRGRPAGEATGIEIEVDKKSQAKDEFDFARLPEVTLDDAILKVAHPHYEGLYSLQEQRGTVRVNGPNALTAFLRTVFPVILVERDGLALHSSCIIKDGGAYIFAGPSGSGKSTIVRLTGNPVLYSDEITFLRKGEKGDFLVYHSPFRSDFFTPYQPPVSHIAGVFFLKQDSRVFIEPIPKIRALPELLSDVFCPLTGAYPLTEKIFNLCCDFLNEVPAVELHFKKDNTFWGSIDEYESARQKT